MKGTVPSSIAESAQMAENAWYPARAMFVNPLTDGRKEPFGSLPNEGLKICTLSCTLKSEKHVPDVTHVRHWLVELSGCHRCNLQ